MPSRPGKPIMFMHQVIITSSAQLRAEQTEKVHGNMTVWQSIYHFVSMLACFFLVCVCVCVCVCVFVFLQTPDRMPSIKPLRMSSPTESWGYSVSLAYLRDMVSACRSHAVTGSVSKDRVAYDLWCHCQITKFYSWTYIYKSMVLLQTGFMARSRGGRWSWTLKLAQKRS